MAHSIGVSESSLYLIFRNEIGRTFSRVIQERKIETAKYLLQKGHLSLNEIAAAIGCEPPSFFAFSSA